MDDHDTCVVETPVSRSTVLVFFPIVCMQCRDPAVTLDIEFRLELSEAKYVCHPDYRSYLLQLCSNTGKFWLY